MKSDGTSAGVGAHASRLKKSMASTPCCDAGRSTLIMRPWVVAPRQVRLPPQTFRFTTAGLTACSARQLVASVPGWVRKLNKSFSLGVQVRHELAVLVVGMSVVGEHLDPLGEVGDHRRPLAVFEVPGDRAPRSGSPAPCGACPAPRRAGRR